MERETKLLTDMLNNLHEMDISLSGTDVIHESQVARQLEKLTVNLEKMANLKNEMDSSSSSEMRIPIELFAALDKKDQTSLDAFEKQLMKQAVEKGDEMRAQARQRQEIESRLQSEIFASKGR
jgi:hypothetical protein